MPANLDSKANKRKLRQLAGVAYERELGAALSKLESDFAQWRRGEIDPFELSDRIHRFHDGISRELYVLYDRLHPGHAVARAVALQVLQEADVPPELLEALERPLHFYKKQLTESAGQDEDKQKESSRVRGL